MAELHRDPGLDAAAATGALRGAAPDLFFRLGMYTMMPFSICRLCRRLFPTTYLRACLDFLHMPADELDLGFPLPFSRGSLDQGQDRGCQCEAVDV